MFAFGMSNFLLGTYLFRAIKLDAAVLSMGFIFGGCAQLYAGVTNFFKGETIKSWICFMFGIWWQSFVGSLILPLIFSAAGWENNFGCAMWFNIVWLTFFIGVEVIILARWKEDIVSPIAVGFVILTCIFLTINAPDPIGSGWALKAAGVTGMLSGVLGFYSGAGRFLNLMFGTVAIPQGLKS